MKQDGEDKFIFLLQENYRLIDEEAKQLAEDIGVPICVPDCGRCCEENSVTASGVESRLMALWFQEQSDEIKKKIIKACEEWLTGRDQYINVYRGMGTGNCTPAEIDKANNEGQYIFVKTNCPMLDEEKRCMIYPVRPMVCRTFGVTRVISRLVCKRPTSPKYETEIYRAYRKGSRNCISIDQNLQMLKDMMGTTEEYRTTNVFVATAMYSEIAPQKFMTLLYHNMIPTARLLHFNETAILTQAEWQEIIDREGELRFLCSPVPEYKDPRDETAAMSQFHMLVKGEGNAQKGT